MNTVWKYGIDVKAGLQEVEVPAGAQLLSVDDQSGVPTLWFLVDTDNVKIPRKYILFGTGHEIPNDVLESLNHVGTINHYAGFVWHIFEIVGAPQARSVQ
jgi:hypothetical protein